MLSDTREVGLYARDLEAPGDSPVGYPRRMRQTWRRRLGFPTLAATARHRNKLTFTIFIHLKTF